MKDIDELHQRTTAGFTLLEVIMALVIAAILGTMLVSFMGTNMTQSANPINMVTAYNKLDEVMERIVNDYKTQIKNSTLNLSSFRSTYVTAKNGVDGVDVTSIFVSYNNTTGAESSCSYGLGCKNLKVTLTRGDQSVTTLFTE